jgi:spore maturation protein SpmB
MKAIANTLYPSLLRALVVQAILSATGRIPVMMVRHAAELAHKFAHIDGNTATVDLHGMANWCNARGSHL